MLNAAPRFGIAIAVAAGVTFGVALMMQGLISSGGSVLQENDMGKLVEFVHVQQDDETRTKDRQPKKPPTPPKEPPKPEMAKPDFDRSADAMDIGGLDLGADLSVDAGLSGSGGDGEYLPIVKVAPQYPRRAAMKGIEGYVVLEFTVSKLGTVVDPQVIEADPPNIFNRAAIRAATKFKYKPKIENGEAIEVPGVRNIIRFELDDSSKRR
ncbi:energy transducer TonB [Bermanella marisrubri]|uniref:Protein TonB n=1 Tax=Bermanella marisrubri TaxID=207949 RepID=Q1N1H5_9GAMM|nr:energy transducer TonB [Bermanella marisrubri]EAT12075.1 putative TonB2 protein [Oceanobacter sp. RED65] [Bermanella marisrubri]